jgi:hypothetical protein
MRTFLCAILALVGALAPTGSAAALTPTPPDGLDATTILAAVEDEEEGEAEASEEEILESEDCDPEEEECEEESAGEAPPECLLTSVRPTILVSAASGRVRLQVRYAASSPVAVAVSYGLHGAKGSLFLGSERKRFGKKGVLRLNRGLTVAQTAKAMAAKDFTVRIRVLEAPAGCQSVFDRHLTLRRATPSGLSWQARE